MGFLLPKKTKRQRYFLTEVDDMAARLEHTPKKLLRRLAQESGVSKVLHGKQLTFEV